tara:strand:- start:15734 stop:16873 length:1140 start_codon:yes stop_codon:yes gene_type:complete
MIVAINALNSNSGGGESIRNSYLKLLNKEKLSKKYFVIASKKSDINFINNENIKIIKMGMFASSSVFAPIVYDVILNKLLKKISADIVLNIGDLIIRTEVKQIYVFDWSYALEVHPKVWERMNAADWIRRKIKVFLIRKNLRRPNIVIAQTKYIAEKLQKTYELEDVRVLNNAVTLNASVKEKVNYWLPAGKLLFYPSIYYPHKNIEIFIPLAKIIKEKNLDCKIITTVNPNTIAAKKFLKFIELMELKDTIINIGQVPSSEMSGIYKRIDALLMPTLLESFSIVYLEAMYHKVPILTSNMWFARSVCGNAAVYFDPLDENDIYNSIEKFLTNNTLRASLIKKGVARLSQFPTWDKTFTAINGFINESLSANSLSRKNK